MRISPVPPTTAVGLLGVSNTAWSGLTLPFDLALVGAPGCRLLVSAEVQVALSAGAGAGDWSVPIPASPSAIGAQFFQQVMVFDSVNPFGAVFSDAGAAVIGS